MFVVNKSTEGSWAAVMGEAVRQRPPPLVIEATAVVVLENEAVAAVSLDVPSPPGVLLRGPCCKGFWDLTNCSNVVKVLF